MQHAAADQDQASVSTAAAGEGVPDDAPPIPTEGARLHEEMRMLFMGFGTGLLIAGVFLVYIVFEYAKWLP